MKNSDMPAMPSIAELGDIATTQGGLTKREYFAGLAMQALLSDHTVSDTPDAIARVAVAHSDALLYALNKKGE